mmetsp:Transcript_45774/g.99819  ORF Transcript_45774/g.99819 Transcript_45774/m.99819 type:complete len:225 (+) Transcript_45774:52-726(+)
MMTETVPEFTWRVAGRSRYGMEDDRSRLPRLSEAILEVHLPRQNPVHILPELGELDFGCLLEVLVLQQGQRELVQGVIDLPIEDVVAPAADHVSGEQHVETLDRLGQGPGDGNDALILALIAMKIEIELFHLRRHALRNGLRSLGAHLHAREAEREVLDVLHGSHTLDDSLHASHVQAVVGQVQLQHLQVFRQSLCNGLCALQAHHVPRDVELQGLQLAAKSLR